MGIQIIFSLVLAGALGILVWGLWPAPRQSKGFDLTSKQYPELGGQPYRLVLEWPAWLRVGETGRVDLRLEPLSQPAEGLAPPTGGGHLVLEGRLELGSLVGDLGTARAPLSSGLAGRVAWEIKSLQSGIFSGTVWSYLDPVLAGGGAGSQEPIGAQEITLVVRSVLGLGQTGAVLLGLAGSGAAAGVLIITSRKPQKKATLKGG